MKSGIEPHNKLLLESLEKKYQIFLEAPEGEISVYLALNKNDEVKSDAKQPTNNSKAVQSFTSSISENTLNLLG